MSQVMAAIKGLWEDTVGMLCPQIEPTPIRMDWSVFESKFSTTLSETGFYRYLEWVSNSLKRKNEASSSQTKRVW